MRRWLSLRFISPTGEPGHVKAITAEFSATFFKGNATSGADTVSHSPQVFAFDQAGRLQTEFYNASVEAMTGVMRHTYEMRFSYLNLCSGSFL